MPILTTYHSENGHSEATFQKDIKSKQPVHVLRITADSDDKLLGRKHFACSMEILTKTDEAGAGVFRSLQVHAIPKEILPLTDADKRDLPANATAGHKVVVKGSASDMLRVIDALSEGGQIYRDFSEHATKRHLADWSAQEKTDAPSCRDRISAARQASSRSSIPQR